MSNVIDLFAAFAVDTAAEENGIYTQLPGCGDTEFLVARANNKSYNRLLEKLYKQNKPVLTSKGDAAEKKSEEIMVEVFSKTVLLGWKGNVTIKGVPTPYSKEAATQLLNLKEFRSIVTKVAEDHQVFLEVKDAEDEKN